MTRRFKELLAKNELCRIFCLGRLINPVLVDLFGLGGGFDGFWLDQEHVGLTWHDIQQAAIAARANGFDQFVRMAPTNYAQVTQNLEAGAGGVMAAQIRSAVQAEEFVTWTKFAPRGMRGMNTSGRDADYTYRSQADFAERANREHFVAIQIETLGALSDADAIAAIDGVDLLFVGPADLSQSLGVLGQTTHAKVWEAIDAVAAACRRHGKHWGIVPADPAFAERAYEKGCRMISLGTDILAVRRGIDATKEMNKRLFGSR
ncbi:MAG TPA: aldolase/citrate lyase family protein [Pirellulales bacterium]|nr:aldolase/citrate lyase family protein [Pirellulales bacterium]